MDLREALTVIRKAGAAFVLRKPEDTDTRWRVQMDGVMLWGDGQNPPYAGMGMMRQNGRVFLEINAVEPISICLNNKNGGAISLTNEKGRLVIRDERKGSDHIIGIIGDEDPNYES